MPLISNPTTKLLEYVLSYRNQRHDVIAANIANANTPGYRAFDLVLDEAAGTASNAVLPRRTDPRHFGASSTQETSGNVRSLASDAEPRLDGNNVSLEDELLKLLENRTLYQTTFELRDRVANLTALAREVR
jgi:flagellar basal-body rod protein FlgB